VAGLVFIIVALGIDWRQFQRVTRDDFEVGSAFIALEDFALFDFVNVDIQRVVTLWANNCHKSISSCRHGAGPG
jgi:hypothetical protein